MLVVNKIDRPAARPDYVVDMAFDLFVELGASDEQTDFRVVYASGIQGIAGAEPDELKEDLGPLFDAIIESIPPPKADTFEDDGLQALVSSLIYTWFLSEVPSLLLLRRYYFSTDSILFFNILACVPAVFHGIGIQH